MSFHKRLLQHSACTNPTAGDPVPLAAPRLPAAAGVSVGPALRRDAAAIALLLRDAAPDTVPVPQEEIARRIGEYEVVRHPCFGVVGAVAVRKHDEERCEIRSLVVAPGWGSCGLGQFLVRRTIYRALAMNCWLGCITLRPTFFERLGFVPVPLDSLPPKANRDETIVGRRRVAMAWSASSDTAE